VVHGHPDRLPEAPPGALRLHLARWRVGLAGSGNTAPSVAELCSTGARVVQREGGASSQKALVAAAEAEGGRLASGPVVAGHLEAARRVAAGAPAGVTMEPAALQLGLAFTALEEHVVELWVDERWRAHPGAEALANALGSAAFSTRMGLVGGYELADAGRRGATA
jgi:molybdate-binding protein